MLPKGQDGEEVQSQGQHPINVVEHSVGIFTFTLNVGLSLSSAYVAC